MQNSEEERRCIQVSENFLRFYRCTYEMPSTVSFGPLGNIANKSRIPEDEIIFSISLFIERNSELVR
ncbi:unnamed protein product [Larinioides sclopetarius]|uniref:Maturase K n=1 Tax=Larinioides sclopetarius TaxID=280406 RepID=A0AAV2ADT1_9ARAC